MEASINGTAAFGVRQTFAAVRETMDAVERGVIDDAEACSRWGEYGAHVRRIAPELWREIAAGQAVERPIPLPRLVSAFDAPAAPPQDWVARPMIPAGLPGLWVGEDGSGKDSTYSALGVAAAAGIVPFGHDAFDAVEPSPVVQWSAEDPLGLMLSRYHALVRGAGVAPRDTLSRIHLLGSESGFTLDSEGWTDHVIAEIRRVGARLAMIGPLREITSGSENDSTEMRPFIRRVRRICNETGAAVAVNHHAAKPTQGTTKKDRIRGSTALRGMSRWTVWVEELPENRILMEPIKLTVGSLPEPWILERSISSAPDGSWWKASFQAVRRDTLARSDAEKAVRQILETAPGSNSTQIRDYCQALRIPPTESAKALNTLHKLDVVTFDPGPKGSKLWRLALPASPGDATT